MPGNYILAVAICLGLMVVGAVGLMLVDRRAVHRRNGSGLDKFNSYMSLVAARAFEKLLSVALAGMTLFGLLGFGSALVRLLNASRF